MGVPLVVVTPSSVGMVRLLCVLLCSNAGKLETPENASLLRKVDQKLYSSDRW